MQPLSPIEIVERWQDAVNRQDLAELLIWSDPMIEMIGPRSITHGHEILGEWLQRAKVRFTTQAIYAQGNRVVVAQQAQWNAEQTSTIIAPVELASSFQVQTQRVTRVARFDSLEEALQDAQLTLNNKV